MRLQSDNALDRARAIVAATEDRDTVAIHKLVYLLDDQDIAVRMFAINGLRRLVGEDFGYRYYELPERRAEAVARWQEALRSNALTLRSTSQPTTSAGVTPAGTAVSTAGGG